jgi:ribosomal protein L40E
MPILDPVKKSIAQKARLYKKICRDCGSTNASTAIKMQKMPRQKPALEETRNSALNS